MNRGIKRIAFILAFVFITETVLADTNMENLFDFAAEEMQSDNTFEFDNEHVEEAIETTSEEIVIPDEAISEGSIIADIIEDISDLADSKPEDAVISEAAIDYEIDNSELPPEAEALLDEYYSDLEDSDKFLLNTYLLVREDTMEICCNDGYTVRESIPYALIMQIMETDLGSAKNMISAFGSQKSAYDAAYDCSCKMYDYACFSDENVRNMFKEYVLKGYVFDKIMNAYAVSVYFNSELSDVISEEIAYEDNEASEFAEKYCININTAEEILSEYTAEEFETLFDEIYNVLKKGNQIAPISENKEDASFLHDSFNQGPLSYVNGTDTDIDPSTGAVHYVENICNIPGIAGLDLNIDLIYTSASPIQAREYYSDINKAYNWQFSFPSITNNCGELLDAYGQNEEVKTPRYLIKSDGSSCEMYKYDNEYHPIINHSEDFTLYKDTAHSGGTNSEYYVKYMSGKYDYFDIDGHWIKTRDRFGNKIEAILNRPNMTIHDSCGNTVTISMDNSGNQTVTRPDGSQVVIHYDTAGNKLTSITQPGNLVTEFTYGADPKDKFHSKYITKIKKPTGLEHCFSYEYIKRPKSNIELVQLGRENEEDPFRYEWQFSIIDSEYEYGRIAEEHLYFGGKEYNKKKYSYKNDFMRAAFGYNVLCSCYSEHDHYYKDKKWRCVMNSNSCKYCDVMDIKPAYSNMDYNYSTTIKSIDKTGDEKTSVTYTYNERNLNTSIEKYSDSQLLNKTEFNYLPISPLNTPETVKFTEGAFVKTDKYTYDNREHVTEHKVLDGSNKLYSQENYEYDYEHYGTLTKITKKADDNTNAVVENTLLNDGTSLSGKVISRIVTTKGDEKESASDYKYDAKGRNIETLDYIDKNETQYIKTIYTYNDNVCPALVSDVKIENNSGSQSYTYDKLGNITSVKTQDNKKTIYKYDSMGNITNVTYTDTKGVERASASLDYDYTNNIIKYTDEEGRTATYDYDPVGNLVSVSKGNVEQEAYTYDNFLRIATYTAGKAVTSYKYDVRDRIISKEIKEGNTTLGESSYGYFVYKNSQATYEYLYNGIRNEVKKDILDRVISEVSYSNKASYEYDMLGNVIKDTQGYLTTTYERDSAGNILSTSANDGIKTSAAYDMLGRMTSSTDGNGNTTLYTYNVLGLVTSEKIPFYIDSSGKMRYIINTNTYDNVGNLTANNSGGTITTYEYDYRNKVIQEKCGNLITDYIYDKAGNMTQYSTGGGKQIHKYEYDSMNRLVKYTDAMGNSEHYEYDRYNDMTKKTDRNGNALVYTYNGLHQMTSEKGEGVNNTWEYNVLGKLSRETNDNYKKEYSYNSVGLVSKEFVYLNNDDYKVLYYYDAAGNKERAEYYWHSWYFTNGTEYIHNYRNKLSQVNKVTDEEGHSTKILSYSYDANGNLTCVDYEAGVRKECMYNAANMVTEMNLYETYSNQKYLYIHILYGYDSYGRLVSKSGERDNNTFYKYDNSGQLVYEETVDKYGNNDYYSYTYDNLGNRTSMTCKINNWDYNLPTIENYYYDNNNHLISKTTKGRGTNYYRTDYTYDKNGNQIFTEESPMSDTGAFRLDINRRRFEKLAYNGLNQLVKYESNFINSNYKIDISTTVEYAYMPNGYRVSKIVDGSRTDYIWDDDNVAMEVNEGQQNTRYFYRGNDLIADEDRIYISDGEGNVMNTYDGSINDANVYRAYGNTDRYEDIVGYEYNNAPYGYRGQMYDKETGLYYLRNRYYNPNTGRFITEDPIKDGYNWYAYCGNNPVNYVDPKGLKPGDIFDSMDKAAIDAGNYFLAKTYADNVEYCARIYKVDDNKYSYKYLANYAENKELAFSVRWGRNSKPMAVLHTHVFYDESNPNNMFSTPVNTTGDDKNNDVDFAEKNNILLYLAAPTGELKLYKPEISSYDSQTNKIKNDILISDKLIVDPKYEDMIKKNNISYPEISKETYNLAKEIINKLLHI